MAYPRPVSWPTFILDLANNHNGSVEFGCEIIKRHAEIIAAHGVSAAIKFQWRDLEDYRHGDENYQAKFNDTQILKWAKLKRTARDCGLQIAATAFDPGAAKWLKYDVDFAKIASCSARDWETLEAIKSVGLPTIASTGGLHLGEVDQLIAYCDVLMHCVSIYPTLLEDCNLSKIGTYKRRYPGMPIGWSTHESPDETIPIQMAVAHGATIFERHIGLDGCNAYSSTPGHLDRWISAWELAQSINSGSDTQDRERMALAKVERKDQDNSRSSPYSSIGGLESGAVSPSWLR